MASIEQPAQALGFSPERGDADADAADWEGVSRATATSYANAGDLYGEEEVGKTVVSTRISCGIFVTPSVIVSVVAYIVRKEARISCVW